MSGESIRAYVGLGGNVGDVEDTMMEALMAIDGLPQTSIRAQSRLYRSPPWGRTDQDDFINAVIELRTRLAARVLLDYLLEVETRFGRVRGEDDKWGPRTLDLDLLIFGEESLNLPGMHVPHPRMHERAFVLVPLAEIAATLQIPGRGQVSELLAAIDSSGIEAID
jgi:2-amino-4-hydroxy-6-hydroxymethyldihydropteridine diphosphokinase